MSQPTRIQAEPTPDAAAYEVCYQTALEKLRREQPDEAFLAYLDTDSEAATLRFRDSEEFDATYQLLRGSGLPEHGSLMDLGAGNGMAALAFAARKLVVTAVEPCQHGDYGSDAIQARASKLGLPISVLASWGENLPLPTDSFDVVYTRQCLHHAYDLDQIIREAARVLKPGGLFFAVREHVVSNELELELFQASHPMAQLGVPEYAYPLARYLQAVQAAGLVPLRVFGPYSYPLHLERSSLRMLLGKYHSPLSGIVGRHSSNVLLRLAEDLLTWRLVGMLMNVLRKQPGRLYSFLARLPEDTEKNDSAYQARR